MTILDGWISDLPQQFQEKDKIKVLVNAFARQMEEIDAALRQINEETDISTATGVNLDRIGDIVAMSRKDAAYVLRSARKQMTDDVYRAALRYKAIRNNTNCTYSEIMDAMSLLWDTDIVTYKEDPERPATICMILPTVNVDAIDPSVGRILSIKPSGVAMIYFISYMAAVIYAVAIETASMPSITMTTAFPLKEATDASNVEISCSIAVDGDEKFESFLVQCKDLWYLDGTYLLDGERILDAEIIEEAI